jgi:hypothetical protein
MQDGQKQWFDLAAATVEDTASVRPNVIVSADSPLHIA